MEDHMMIEARMISQYLWIWTLSTIVLTWMAFYVLKRTKTKTKTAGSATAATEGERRRENGVADVIIVGAGVAGSALAYTLAKDGRRVHVIERDLREPDRIVGEVMLPGGHLMLIQLGLQDCLEEIDTQRVDGLTLYKDGKHNELPYPLEEKKFPFDASGRSFHHGRFIQRLRQKAASLPNVHLEEGTVNSLIEEKGVIKGVKYKSKAGEEETAFASLTIVCDGAHSNLRRSLCDPKVEVHSYILGLISKDSRLPNPESIHLIMSKPSFTMLYQISNTDVRCVVEVPAKNAPSMANGDMSTFLEKIMAVQVPPKLYNIFMKAVKEGKIKTTQAKRMSISRCDKKGVIVIGDALNMRHPVIAAGMTVALSDIVILRDLLRPLHGLDDPNRISQVLKSFYALREPMAATVNTLASVFHEVLVASADEAKEELREACFGYLCRGGNCTSGMMALLAGLNPRPLSLMFHLSAITLSAVARLLFPFPSPHRLWITFRLLQGFLNLWLNLLLFDLGKKHVSISSSIWRFEPGLAMKNPNTKSASGLQLATRTVVPCLKAEGVTQMFSPATVAAYRRSLPSN